MSEMPFLEHLRELRDRLFRAFLGLVGGTILSFVWANQLFDILTDPIRAHFTQVELIGTGPADAFITKILVAFFSGALISAPITFYQLWKFIAPGLLDHEKKWAAPFVAVTTLCFLVGASFCFYIVFPFAFKFFSDEFISIGLKPQIRISEYLSFSVKLILIFGAMFELPVLAYVLGRLGLVTHTQLRKHFRIAIVSIFVVAAVVTPPDVITQLFLAIPLCALYWSCIHICRYAESQGNLRK
jgi:sec-independent protein translocase protein TatC